jgi:hypothetical protein
MLGAAGWVAGLVGVSTRNRAAVGTVAGQAVGVRKLCDWFLPLLHLTSALFVQQIKLVKPMASAARVRAPHYSSDKEARQVENVLEHALAHRPAL